METKEQIEKLTAKFEQIKSKVAELRQLQQELAQSVSELGEQDALAVEKFCDKLSYPYDDILKATVEEYIYNADYYAEWK